MFFLCRKAPALILNCIFFKKNYFMQFTTFAVFKRSSYEQKLICVKLYKEDVLEKVGQARLRCIKKHKDVSEIHLYLLYLISKSKD